MCLLSIAICVIKIKGTKFYNSKKKKKRCVSRKLSKGLTFKATRLILMQQTTKCPT